MSGFELNLNEDVLRQVAREAGEKFASDHQVALDDVFASHAGQPVGEIKPALASAWAGVSGNVLADPELTSWAQHTADGNRVILEVEEPKI